MKTTSLAATLSFVISLFIVFVHVHTQGIDSCDGIANNTIRSQICLSGKCPFICGSANESAYFKCDQVCVVEPCASLSCNSSDCFQRCLAGGCDSLHCTSDDCTQTCMRNCSRVNCTVKSKCNQQCEKGYCGLHASGDGVAVQNCAEKCSDVKCDAVDCRQDCEGEGCDLECSEGIYSSSSSCFTSMKKQQEEQVTHLNTNPRAGQHAHSHITRAVAARKAVSALL